MIARLYTLLQKSCQDGALLVFAATRASVRRDVPHSLGMSAHPPPPQRTLSTLTKEQADVQKKALQGMLGRIFDDADRTGGVGELQETLAKLEDELWARGRVHRIVITGGPCAGKSTIMSDLVQMLKERNYLVFTMPEVATEMFK